MMSRCRAVGRGPSGRPGVAAVVRMTMIGMAAVVRLSAMSMSTVVCVGESRAE